MRIVKSIFLFLCLFLLQTGCITTQPKSGTPRGFALYPDTKVFRAVSPDGVMYRIRIENNKPFAELTFWKKALKKRMLDAGYNFVNESEISTENQKGYLLELTAPLGEKDYTYLVAIFLNGKKEIIIAEACGEINRFTIQRDKIIAAIKTIKIAK